MSDGTRQLWLTCDEGHDGEVEVWEGESPRLVGVEGSRYFVPDDGERVLCTRLLCFNFEAWHAVPSLPRVNPGHCFQLREFSVWAVLA